MIRFAIVGSGYRSLFYVRIAKAMPDTFELVALLCRGEEKANKLALEYGIHTTISEDEVVQLKPDFIVSAVNKTSMSEVVMYWAKKGIPVLSETPAALDLDMLKLMKKGIDEGLKIQVAEQYFLYASVMAMIGTVESKIIGEPVSLGISLMHGYHAASIMRRLLKTGLETVDITGKTFDMKVTDTRTRYEILTEGKVVNKKEEHFIFEYESGKVAFYDFMSDQYRSPIRHKHINVRGTRGEIIDDMVYYLNEGNREECKKLEIIDPLAKYGLNEDESAIARIMIGMKEYVDTGVEIYPMNEALYDAYISALMEKGAKAPYETIKANFMDI